MNRNVVLLVFSLVLMTFGLSLCAAFDDRAARLSLEWISPVLTHVIVFGDFLLRNPIPLINIFGSSLILGILGFGWWHSKNMGSRFSIAFAASIALAIAGQLAFLNTWLVLGLTLYACSLFAFGWTYRHARLASQSNAAVISADVPFSGREALTLFTITMAAGILRIYGINHIPSTFEGELANFAVAGTSLRGMFDANAGVNGTWAPLGLLYYVPIYVTTKLFGTTLVALRLSSAFVGIFTVPLLYAFLRRFGGVVCATIGAAFFALDTLHIGWSRTDIHPHGVTTWPVVILAWLTLLAIDKGRLRHYIAIAVVMGLTWHQYPSGQTSFLVPVLALGVAHALDSKFRARSGGKLPWIVLGVLLWMIGLPASYYVATKNWEWLNPFTLTGPRAMWSRFGENASTFQIALGVIGAALNHLGDIIKGVFWEVPYLFHQDILPPIPPLPNRTIMWIVAPFAAIGMLLLCLQARRKRSLTLLAWILVAALPGILSESAYPKRESTLFPAIECVSAYFIAWLALQMNSRVSSFGRKALMGIVIAFGIGFSVQAALWFSPGRAQAGVPREVYLTDAIKRQIKPGTIIIADVPEGYAQQKLNYLMVDALAAPENWPVMWYRYHLTTTKIDIRSLIEQPSNIYPHVDTNLALPWYRWTKLRSQVDALRQIKSWDRLLVVIEMNDYMDENNLADIPIIESVCGRAIEEIPNGGSVRFAFRIYQCSFR